MVALHQIAAGNAAPAGAIENFVLECRDCLLLALEVGDEIGNAIRVQPHRLHLPANAAEKVLQSGAILFRNVPAAGHQRNALAAERAQLARAVCNGPKACSHFGPHAGFNHRHALGARFLLGG
jgi:hypothetical protein